MEEFFAKPYIGILKDEQKHFVHENSIKILENTGIKVSSTRALEIFKKQGQLKIRNDIVYFSRDIINWAIACASKRIDVYSRTGQIKFSLDHTGLNQAIFGIGVTNLHYQNPFDESVTPFTREHLITGTRLGHYLESYDLVSTIGNPQDVDILHADLYAALEMYANTTKPLVILVSEEKSFELVLDLIEYLHGNISNKPFILPYFNPVTPLVMNDSTVLKMEMSIMRGLPIIFSNYSMYGATSPIRAAGSLVLLNAELLAGLIMSQLMKAGAQVILGSLPTSFDMITMGSVYTPRSFLINLACAEMMEFYNIPHCGTSGSGIGWGTDILAAGNLWFNHLTSCLGKIGLVPFVGGNFDSLVFSPMLIVYSDYIIRKVRSFAKGFSLTDESVNLPEIEKVGAGGNFLMADSTLDHLLQCDKVDDIWPNLSLDKWVQLNKPKAENILKEFTINQIINLKNPADYDELIEKGLRFIHKLK